MKNANLICTDFLKYTLTVLLAGMVYVNVLATDELIGYWKFDENTGTTVYDSTSYENDGTLTNMSSPWVTGIFNSGLSFDGDNDYIDMGYLADGALISFTYTAWIKVGDLSGSSDDVTTFMFGKNLQCRIALSREANPSLFIRWRKADGYYTSYELTGSITSGQWHHIKVTYDDSSKILTGYLDGIKGIESDTSSVGRYSNFDWVQIGTATGYNNFIGTMDEVRLYNYARPEPKLVGHWAFDENTGTTVCDSSSYQNDGTLTNMSSPSPWVTGVFNSGLSFDGSGYVDCGTSSIYNFNDTNQFTISFWMKPNSLSTDQGLIGKRPGAWMYTPYQLAILSDGRLKICIGDGTTAGMIHIPPACLSTGNWQHITATYDGSVLRGYVNGEEKASAQLDMTLTSTNVSLKIGFYASYYFDGKIDQVKMYNYARSPFQINREANDLRGDWEMNTGSGTTVTDYSDQGNDGTMHNFSSPWVSGHLQKDGTLGYALSFDGTDDYIDCGTSSIYNFNDTNQFTISFWMKPNSLSTDQGLIGKRPGAWMYTPYQLAILPDGRLKICIGDGTTAGMIHIPPSCLSTGNWQHITATYDGSVLRGYVNGEEKASAQLDMTLTSTNVSLKIGVYASYYFDGEIDKVKLYGRALNAEQIKSTQLLTASINQNYYTGENAIASTVLDIDSAASLSGWSLVAKDSQGNTLGTVSSPGLKTDLSYATSSLANGENTIAVELQNSSGECAYLTYIDILKRAANTGNEVKIDYKNGIVLRNGEGFFPIGIYVYSDSADELEEIASLNFNSVTRSYQVPASSDYFFERAVNAGLYIVARPELYASEYVSLYKTKWDPDPAFLNAYLAEEDNILDGITYAKDESNLLAYYTFDEPLPSTQREAAEYLYEDTNTEDGYHPTWAVLRVSEIINAEFAAEFCDILATDTYVKPPRISTNEASSVDWVTKYTCIAKEKALKLRKPLWMVLCGEYTSGYRRRAITPDEQRCQTWLTLIHGAKGIFYYIYPYLTHQATMDCFEELNENVADLAPSILMPDLEQTVTYYNDSVEAEFDPVNNEFVDVQVSLRKAPAGESYDYVLLATNTREYSIDVDYTISLLGSSGTISRMFDTSTYSVSNGSFSDTLTAFATRAYTFSSTSTDPITISVDMDALGTYTEPEVYPNSGRSGMTNIMQNPSLEDNDITNWPNYVWPWAWVNTPINSTNQSWGLESTGAYHGSKCLKITKNDSRNPGAYFNISPQHTDTNGKDYTFSFYIKTDQAGVDAGGVGISIGGSKLNDLDEFPTTRTINSTSWTRYEFTANIPANFDMSNYLYIILSTTGTVWIDAIQVEQASSASSFTTN